MRYVLLVSTIVLMFTLLGTGTEAVLAATIDFESYTLGGATYLDVPELLTFPDAGGSGVAVTITGNTDLRIYDLFKFAGNPSATGQALIDWPWPSGSNPAGTTFLFDKAVASCSLSVGDFGSDDDSPLKIRAFDESDVEIASDSLSWSSLEGPPFGTVAVHASGIRKIIFTSGGHMQGVFLLTTLCSNPTTFQSNPGPGEG